MELLNFIHQIPLPIVILVIAILVLVTVVLAYQYAKMKGLEGIRVKTYQLILKAERVYKESGAGQQKMKWVVSQARLLLPTWLQIFITEEMLEKMIQVWFDGIKDLLDDGKVNGSQHNN